MLGLIGKKIGMLTVPNVKGKSLAATVVQIPSNYIVQVKTNQTDGYTSVKLGAFEIKQNKLNSPRKGEFDAKSISAYLKTLREFRVDKVDDSCVVGKQVKVENIFSEEDWVDVVAKSKGKGFQGGVKRWGWTGGKKTHGSMHHRRPGSIGASANPSRVFKGRGLPGHMGAERVSVHNLLVLKVDIENQLLVIAGAIPGSNGGTVLVKKALKKASLESANEPLIKEQKVEEAKAGSTVEQEIKKPESNEAVKVKKLEGEKTSDKEQEPEVKDESASDEDVQKHPAPQESEPKDVPVDEQQQFSSEGVDSASDDLSTKDNKDSSKDSGSKKED